MTAGDSEPQRPEDCYGAIIKPLCAIPGAVACWCLKQRGLCSPSSASLQTSSTPPCGHASTLGAS